MRIMEITMDILGILAILVGMVWFLQGISVLPGSPMTGQMQWVINGLITFIVGVVLVIVANWQRIRGGSNRPHGMTP